MKKKNKKKWLIPVVIIVAVVLFLVLSSMLKGTAAPVVSHTELHPMSLVNNISTKGMVESIEKSNVYTTLGYTIKTVNVETGDKVKAGQVLAELDTENLSFDIAQRKSELNASQQNNLNNLSNNERIYNEAISNLSGGTNSQILNAENSLRTAALNLEKAEKDYKNALDDFNDNINSQVMSAESSLTTAKLDLDTKETSYENNKILFSIGAVSQDAFKQSEDAYTSSLNKYNDAVTNLENARLSEKRSLDQAETSLNSARTNYENALASRNAAIETANQDIERYISNIESAKISVNNDSSIIAIQKLEKQLEDSIIKAPISGTVTAVYAKEGATGSGLLFVIEDTDNLKITTKIKEYDIARIKNGMDVLIKSDSTGDTVYEGVMSKINPAANKTSGGEINTTSDVEFGAEASILSKQNELKIGMETRITIVLEKKDNVYCVPYDALVTEADGRSYIFIVGDDMAVKKEYIETGMETDFYVEITGGAVQNGVKVVNDAAAMQEGMKVTLK